MVIGGDMQMSKGYGALRFAIALHATYISKWANDFRRLGWAGLTSHMKSITKVRSALCTQN